LAGRVVSDEHGPEPRGHALLLESGDPSGELGLDGLEDGLAVEDLRRHPPHPSRGRRVATATPASGVCHPRPTPRARHTYLHFPRSGVPSAAPTSRTTHTSRFPRRGVPPAAHSPRTTHPSPLPAQRCAQRGANPAHDTYLAVPPQGCATRGAQPSHDTPISTSRAAVCPARRQPRARHIPRGSPARVPLLLAALVEHTHRPGQVEDGIDRVRLGGGLVVAVAQDA